METFLSLIFVRIVFEISHDMHHDTRFPHIYPRSTSVASNYFEFSQIISNYFKKANFSKTKEQLMV